MSGKGDKPRPVDPKKWDENWERIFRPKPEPKPTETLRAWFQRTATRYSPSSGVLIGKDVLTADTINNTDAGLILVGETYG